MSTVSMPTLGVGNDFVRPKPKLKPVQSMAAPATTVLAVGHTLDDISLDIAPVESPKTAFFGRIFEVLHRFSLGAFALLFLLVAVSGIEVGKLYLTAHISVSSTSSIAAAKTYSRPIQGPNLIVPGKELKQTIDQITSQPMAITIADKPVVISPDKIKGWLQVVTDKTSGAAYIHVNQKAISASLNESAKPFIKTPLNQISVNNADGTSRIIASGQAGTKLGDMTETTKQIGKTLLSAKGVQLTVPTETQAFAATTVTDFDKIIEVNIVTKQMYLYQNGNLVHQYPISAGAVATPTPVGQYKIYEKLAVQDMRGWNANGTRYFQPHVRWINYFLDGGYAIHGNYWRPQSWFGAVNSSHGCVSLPDTQAKEVYDWAPIGTTVVTHT